VRATEPDAPALTVARLAQSGAGTLAPVHQIVLFVALSALG
jgi:hypothetical protein